jgi:hypothetical protein
LGNQWILTQFWELRIAQRMPIFGIIVDGWQGLKRRSLAREDRDLLQVESFEGFWSLFDFETDGFIF